MVGEQGELSALQQEFEVPDCRTSGQQLPVKGRDVLLSGRQFPGEEGHRLEVPPMGLLQDTPNVKAGGIDEQ